MLHSSLLLLLGLSFSSISHAMTYNTTACNSFHELCDKRWSEIVHLGAHDSPFVRTPENGNSLSGNQYFNVTVQLNSGVRLLQGQIHPYDKKVQLCHSDCRLMNGGTLEKYLTTVKEWMDQHQNEVVTILLVNNKKIPIKELKPIFEKSGMSDYGYAPPEKPPITPKTWPTLKELIDKKKRAIMFLSDAANEKEVPWLLDEFKYVFETPFEVLEPEKFICYAHRPASVQGQDKLKTALETRVPLWNRFMYAHVNKKLAKLLDGVEMFKPNDTYSAQLNGGDSKDVGNLKDGVGKCLKEYKKEGGMILVDFFNEGSPIKIVDTFNKVQNPFNRVDPGPRPKKEKKKTIEKVKGIVENIKEGQTQNVGTGRIVSELGKWLGGLKARALHRRSAAKIQRRRRSMRARRRRRGLEKKWRA